MTAEHLIEHRLKRSLPDIPLQHSETHGLSVKISGHRCVAVRCEAPGLKRSGERQAAVIQPPDTAAVGGAWVGKSFPQVDGPTTPPPARR